MKSFLKNNYKMNHVRFANLNFKGLQLKDILEEEKFLKFIVTVNSEFIVKANNDNKLKEIINNNYATFDGQIPYFLAKKQNPDFAIEKISGSSLIYDLCEMAKEKNKKVFLLGGYEKSNKEAVENLKRKYKINIDGFSPKYKPYPFNEEHNKIILDRIQNFSPDILFVGFGIPKQELWIDQFIKKLEKIGVKWVVGSGGTFEFVSGVIKRAPKWIQRIGFEGVYRFIQEPNIFRFKRFLLSFKLFKYI